MLISSAELDREEKRLGWQSLQASSPNASPNPSEEETLQAARQLMRNEGWEKALSILYPPAPCKSKSCLFLKH